MCTGISRGFLSPKDGCPVYPGNVFKFYIAIGDFRFISSNVHGPKLISCVRRRLGLETVLLFSLKFTCDDSLLKLSALISSIEASTIIRAECSRTLLSVLHRCDI